MIDDGHKEFRRWPYIVGLLAIIFLLISLEPIYSLRPDPPPSFLDAAGRHGVDPYVWGKIYWERARIVRWKFEYGHALPDTPPEEFRPADEASLPQNTAVELRRAYWSNLQRLWLSPSVWTKRYTIDFHWVPKLIDSFATGVVNAVRQHSPST